MTPTCSPFVVFSISVISFSVAYYPPSSPLLHTHTLTLTRVHTSILILSKKKQETKINKSANKIFKTREFNRRRREEEAQYLVLNSFPYFVCLYSSTCSFFVLLLLFQNAHAHFTTVCFCYDTIHINIQICIYVYPKSDACSLNLTSEMGPK